MMRVFELAKKIGVTSKEIISVLDKMGIPVKNHMSTVEDREARAVLDRFIRKEVAEVAPKGKGISSPAVAPEKKGRVLVKKKKEEIPLVLAPAVAVIPSIPSAAPAVSSPAAARQAAPPAPTPSRVEPLPVSGTAETVSPLTSAKKEEEKREKEKEKKKLPKDLFVEAKKGLPAKFKEKVKKAKKPERWEIEEPVVHEIIAAELLTVPDGEAAVSSEPLPEAATAVATAVEPRKWENFKPLHKRDERARIAAKKAQPSAIADITKPRVKAIRLVEGTTVKEFAEAIGQKVSAVITKLMETGIMATLNQPIDLNAASLIAEQYGLKVDAVAGKTEEEILEEQTVSEDRPEDLAARPPVITVMGHVDHGKTSLLDAVRQTKVAEGEAGGITQHIGAYIVTVGQKRVTFLDTPGHEAFTAMRARGAKVTDIVVLVIAADDGVMPQTVEAINHAKAAGVPIVVAVNKIDKPEANPDRVKNALAEYGLIPEQWGGQTIFAEVSAKKKIGLDHFLEMILLQAEILELRANPRKPMAGTIIEARLDRGRGPVATVLVQEGTLKAGDAFVAGVHWGRVRTLIDDLGRKVQSATPATPVEVIGFDGVPSGGDTFVVVRDERVAREIANQRMQRQRLAEMAKVRRVTLEDLYAKIKEGAVKELKIIIKADVQGSAEAMRESLQKLATPAVSLTVIHAGVGGITDSDVLLASASNAIIIGFNVRPEPSAASLAEREKVDIRTYTVIYDAINDVRSAMEGLLDPTFREKIVGRAEVRQTFNVPKAGVVAGCYVVDGTVSRASMSARVLRDSVVIYQGKVASLRRFKDDVREVASGYECGIGIENFNDIKVGDVVEIFTQEKVAAKL